MCTSMREWSSVAVSLVFTVGLIVCASAPAALAQNATAGAAQKMIKPLTYPTARKGDQVDDYHGLKVADPYRWLEDLDSEERAGWWEAENRLTASFLNEIPARARIKGSFDETLELRTLGTPFREGKNYSTHATVGCKTSRALYRTSLDARRQLLLDPNTLSTDGTVCAVGNFSKPAGNSSLIAFSASGSDWQEWKVRDVAPAGTFSINLMGEVFGSLMVRRRYGFFL